MSDKSGLAAVAAAADSVSRSDHEAALVAARAEGEKAGRDAAFAEGRKAGAEAERLRIAGIDAHAMPGHEKLITDMKADANVTPDMAAGRIIAAEKKLREGQMTAIADVETVTGAVGAAAASTRTDVRTGDEKATTPDGWKADYASSAKLQGEFVTADDYVAAKRAEAAGKVRFLKK